MPHPCIIPWRSDAAQPHAKGFMHPFVDEGCGARQLRMHVSVINPGEATHAPHAHAGEEIMLLLEGTAEATIGDERHPVGPMTAVFCPEHVLHNLRNTGTTPMKYVVVRLA